MDAVGHVDRRGPWLRTRSVAEAHVRTVAEAHGRTQEQGGRKARGASFYTPTGGSGLFLVAGARATDSEEGMTTKATTGLLPMFEVVRVWTKSATRHSYYYSSQSSTCFYTATKQECCLPSRWS